MNKITKKKIVGWRAPHAYAKAGDRYIFSPDEARSLGLTEMTRVFEVETIKYTDEAGFVEALRAMPDYECWDSVGRSLVRSREVEE